MTPVEEAAFLAARQATSRSAWQQYKKSQNAEDEASIKAAAERFRTLPLLGDPALRVLAHRVMGEARGRLLTGDELFPAVIWQQGADETYDGRDFSGSILDFTYILQARAEELAAKRKGWVIEPTTNPAGRRTNEATLAMHALFLDVDGTGPWEGIITLLRELDYCFVAYESGGHAPGTPKWRLVFPLNQPFDTSNEAKREAWKTVYNHVRCIAGSLAGLLSVGFDPATDTPCCPWFLTEKRNATDPVRQVVWQPGHALDLVGLVLALPETPDDLPKQHTPRLVTTTVPLSLDQARVEAIIEALTTVTSQVPSGRRDLYMALPGVLLDRGVKPDDVMIIVEAVSANYPRSHPEKHADNLHCAKTTISKWERDDIVTRIGTLNEVAPQIAHAVDAVLPDPDKAEFLELAHRLARREAAPPPPPAYSLDIDHDAPAWEVPVDLKMLRSFATKMRRKKGKSESVKDAVHWILLDRLLKRKTLADPIEKDAETQLGREDALYRLMGLLAFRFPKNTAIEVVMELLRPSIFLTLEPGENADKWMKMASRWYLMSLASRLEMDSKKEAARKADLEFSRNYFANGRVL